MQNYSHRAKLFAAALSALAGYVDAVGFISVGGFFVSFMSGNTTRMAVGLLRDPTMAAIAAVLIVSFVSGVVLGSVVSYFSNHSRGAAVLLLVALFLALAALAGTANAGLPASIAMALAMGAENTVFQKDGEVRVGLTYMTGTLVKLGQKLASAFLGGSKLAWAPFLLLWLALLSGAILGSLVYEWCGVLALWPAALLAAPWRPARPRPR